jgi:hypothetical protein
MHGKTAIKITDGKSYGKKSLQKQEWVLSR